MRYTTSKIVFQEVPKEISLLFSITGCPLRCNGCHSKELWDKNNGDILDNNVLISSIEKYLGMITCVVFLGGEWHDDLFALLDICKSYSLKTCLYTGLNDVDVKIKSKLNYLKTGRWIESLGGLDSSKTNQRFVDLDTKKDLTYIFQEKK